MAVTLEEIAKIAGVSRTTASRALHGTYPVKAETKDRLLQLAKELDYQPNLAARSLRTERTRTIGIIVDDVASAFTPRIVRGIHDSLNDEHYASIIINAERKVDTEIAAMHDLLGRSIDGIILVESYLQRDGHLPDLAGKPYVFVHRLFNSGIGNCVMVDEHYGARLAVDYLLQLGHRRIAHITGLRGWDATEERLSTYRETLAQAGAPCDDLLVQEGNWSLDSGYRAATKLLQQREKPTAIFAASDVMAIGAMYAIQDLGLRVPQDIAVMGYDNIEFTMFVRPKLSTVTMPCYAMGQQSANLLINLLKDPDQPEEQVKVRGELILRDSTGDKLQ